MAEPFKEYLFEYPYQGKQWGLNIIAASPQDAKDRLKALAWAQYKGELIESIPATSPRGWLVPLRVWWHNFRATLKT